MVAQGCGSASVSDAAPSLAIEFGDDALVARLRSAEGYEYQLSGLRCDSALQVCRAMGLQRSRSTTCL